jgi:hypothetical protein
MKKVLLGLVVSICLVAGIAYAASMSAGGAGPSMTAKGTAYTLTLSPTGAPASDTPAGVISYSWSANPGMCPPSGGIGAPVPCPLPSGFMVRLCWHTDADGMFWINPNTPTQCKNITSSTVGSTSQWQGWVFNSGAKRLRMKVVFSTSGSGSISPNPVTTTSSVTVNY